MTVISLLCCPRFDVCAAPSKVLLHHAEALGGRNCLGAEFFEGLLLGAAFGQGRIDLGCFLTGSLYYVGYFFGYFFWAVFDRISRLPPVDVGLLNS